MPLNFPNTPAVDQIYTSGEDSWIWSGIAWELVPNSSPTLTNLTVTNVITGSVSDISNHGIEDLADVDFASPAENNNVLAYSAELEVWRPITLTSTFTGGSIPNALIINNATGSTSTQSGALRVLGGAAIGEHLYIGGDLRFAEDVGDNYVGFRAPSELAANKIYVLPQSDGDPGQVLTTSGTGILSWSAGGGAGGTSQVGGSNTQIQFNSAGIFAGNSNLTFSTSTNTLTALRISITDTTESTTTATGALKISGGTGILGQLNVGGAVNKFTGNTASTSTTSGTVVVTGGIGISGAVHVGGTITAATAPTSTGHLTNKQYVDTTISAFSIAFGV